jgi:hypothetical protein
MPIINISAGGASGPVVNSTCIACLKDAAIDAALLMLGTDGQQGHNVIALPACTCGAQEFLQQTLDVHPVESQAGHRKKVNALAEHPKNSGRVNPKHAEKIKALGTPPQIGALIGDVPLSSTAPTIAAKRLKALKAGAPPPAPVPKGA